MSLATRTAYVAVVVVLLACLVGGCTTTWEAARPPTADSPSTVVGTYTNSDFGFAIDPPVGFAMRTPSVSDSLPGADPPKYAVSFDPAGGDPVGVAILCFELPRPISDAEKRRRLRLLKARFVDRMDQVEPSTQILSMSLTTIAGVPAFHWERVDNHASQAPVHMEEFCFFGEGVWLYTLTVRAPVSEWRTRSPELLRAAQSFRLLPEQR